MKMKKLLQNAYVQYIESYVPTKDSTFETYEHPLRPLLTPERWRSQIPHMWATQHGSGGQKSMLRGWKACSHPNHTIWWKREWMLLPNGRQHRKVLVGLCCGPHRIELDICMYENVWSKTYHYEWYFFISDVRGFVPLTSILRRHL